MTPYEAFLGMKPRMGLQNINLDKEVTENIWYEEEVVTILEMEDIGDRGLGLLNTYTLESESDHELEILEELEKEGSNGMEKVNSQKEVDTIIFENDKTESTFKRCDM